MQTQPPKIKVLLVEDDEDEHVIIRDNLQEVVHSKYDVEWAADYGAGLEAISTGKFDYFLGDRTDWISSETPS